MTSETQSLCADSRPRLLDLFCGAGGASKGYHDAGFEVVGVDIHPQPRYPYEFVRADALSYLGEIMGPQWCWTGYVLSNFTAIHASPPCQAYTQLAKGDHPRLIEPLRVLLEQAGLPYVIENVPTAPLREPARLCGSSFGLDIRRHRAFETNWPLVTPCCDHSWQTPRFRSLDHSMVKAGKLASVVGVHGHINYPGEFALRKAAMGIAWMTNDELVESIPPRYTEFVGRRLREHLSVQHALKAVA